MPKERTTGQTIGEIGESIFETYAKKMGLIPNKTHNDYGIDFFCQLTSGFSLNKKHVVECSVIGAIVRTSNAKHPRRTLNKKDIESILKADFPILLILVELRKAIVYHKFLDLKMLNKLDEILEQGQKCFALKSKVMSKDNAEFKESLQIITSIEYQSRLRVKFSQLSLTKLVGPTKIKVIQHEDGNFAIVTISDIGNIFDSSRKEHAMVREAFLSHDIDTGIRIPERSIKTAFIDDLRHQFSKAIVVSPIGYSGRKTLILKRNAKICATCDFQLRHFEDEYSFYHKAGISIIFSKRRMSKDRRYYHKLEIIVNDPNAEPLFGHLVLVNFLKNCTSGTEVYLGQNTKEGVDVSNWPNLAEIGSKIRQIEAVYKELTIMKPKFKLTHLRNNLLMRNYAFLDALVISDKMIFGGFMTVPDDVELDWMRVIVLVPFLIQIPDGQIFVEVEYAGKIAVRKGTKANSPVGLELNEKRKVNSWQFVEIDYKIMHPTIIITESISFEIREDKYKEVSIPMDVGIRFYPDRNNIQRLE